MTTVKRRAAWIGACSYAGALAVIAIAAPFAQAAIVFDPAAAHSVGNRPGGITAGDFNHDGFMDLAFTTDTPDKVGILLNNGNGTFAPPVNYFVTDGTGPEFIVAADLDGDGDLDLATANENSNNVSVLSNSGTGTFGSLQLLPVGTFPDRMVAADFDHDGNIDIAVANRDSNDISVLMNRTRPPVRRADVNCDGAVNNLDIDPFVLALTDAAAYQIAFPNCPIGSADINGDSLLNNFDIDPSVACLVNLGCL